MGYDAWARLILHLSRSRMQNGIFQATTSFPISDTHNIEKTSSQVFEEIRAATAVTTAMTKGGTISLQAVEFYGRLPVATAVPLFQRRSFM